MNGEITWAAESVKGREVKRRIRCEGPLRILGSNNSRWSRGMRECLKLEACGFAGSARWFHRGDLSAVKLRACLDGERLEGIWRLCGMICRYFCKMEEGGRQAEELN